MWRLENTNVSPIQAYLDWAAGLLVADEGNNRYDVASIVVSSFFFRTKHT